jgi:hypothetical protein
MQQPPICDATKSNSGVDMSLELCVFLKFSAKIRWAKKIKTGKFKNSRKYI